jgi:LAO/AO transport system kinase
MSDESINKNFHLKKREEISLEKYVAGILSGNISLLSAAITLIESANSRHRELAEQIIEECLPHSGKSIRLGITGVPGVGKSTFIESFGTFLTTQERKVAVLAIDPSSQKSGGSILGDKTRMEDLSTNKNAYVRPSPAKDSLGGVARNTRETIILCEAAGYDTILIETVGVGQSEIAVHGMVDFFLLLMLAGAGDELQGIKRGIMEMADAVVITKADGDNINNSKRAKTEYKNALHLFPASESNWIPTVSICSAYDNSGINDVWNTIQSYQNQTTINGYFDHKRKTQSKYWMYETINEELKRTFFNHPEISKEIKRIEQDVTDGSISPFKAAHLLLTKTLKREFD